MGPAIFIGLLLCATVVLGFVLYGILLSMRSLLWQLRHLWLRLAYFEG